VRFGKSKVTKTLLLNSENHCFSYCSVSHVVFL